MLILAMDISALSLLFNMETLEFIKKYCPVGNGDLILLLAFKNKGKVTTTDVEKRLKLSKSHANRILRKMEAAGFCRREKIKSSPAYLYVFNNSLLYLIKRIFERKIMPYVPLTPEKFLETEEIEIFIVIDE